MPLHFDIFPLFPQTLSISHLNTVNSKHVLKILKKLPWQKTDFSEYYDVLGGNYVTTNYHILKNFHQLEFHLFQLYFQRKLMMTSFPRPK